MCFFSVVIPCYNRENFIAATLDSVLAQQCDDYEIIVVDDGSTDKTRQIVESYAARDVDRIKLLHQQNQGPGAARNKGSKAAIGRYVAFLDSDDLWFPWTLRLYENWLRENNFPALLAGKLVEFAQDDELITVPCEAGKVQIFTDYLASQNCQVLLGAGMAVMRRDTLLLTGGFTERRINAEDHDLALRLGEAAGFINVLSPVTIAYRRHNANVTADGTRTYEGMMNLVGQEQNGVYPGGAPRRTERLSLITMHTRAASFGHLQSGERKYAFKLYFATLKWNLNLRRWRYVVGFPLQWIMSVLKPQANSYA